MEDQVKQDSLNIIVSDTIVKVSDTLNLNLTNAIKLFQGDELLVVKTMPEPVSGVEFWALVIGIIAAIVTVFYTLIALKKLLSNDEQLQSQIDELVKLNSLFERRLRMSVKPHLFINGTQTYGKEKKLALHLHNRGELAFYSSYKIIEGYKDVTFQEWEGDIEIEKNNSIILSGYSYNKPNEIQFVMIITYHDKENYHYESLIEWKNGSAKITKTVEL